MWRKIWDLSGCPLIIKGIRLIWRPVNTGFTVIMLLYSQALTIIIAILSRHSVTHTNLSCSYCGKPVTCSRVALLWNPVSMQSCSNQIRSRGYTHIEVTLECSLYLLMKKFVVWYPLGCSNLKLQHITHFVQKIYFSLYLSIILLQCLWDVNFIHIFFIYHLSILPCNLFS